MAPIGAVVIADTRRLADCFGADRLLRQPAAAVCHRGQPLRRRAKYHLEDIREALAVSRGVPMINADVRSRASAKEILVAVTEHALAQRTGVRR